MKKENREINYHLVCDIMYDFYQIKTLSNTVKESNGLLDLKEPVDWSGFEENYIKQEYIEFNSTEEDYLKFIIYKMLFDEMISKDKYMKVLNNFMSNILTIRLRDFNNEYTIECLKRELERKE